MLLAQIVEHLRSVFLFVRHLFVFVKNEYLVAMIFLRVGPGD